jgi:hypothetical protein
MSENCDNCGQHPKDCTCWVRDEFVERCRRAELFLGLLSRMESSPRVLTSVFIRAILEVIQEDSESEAEYNEKMGQVIRCLTPTPHKLIE